MSWNTCTTWYYVTVLALTLTMYHAGYVQLCCYLILISLLVYCYFQWQAGQNYTTLYRKWKELRTETNLQQEPNLIEFFHDLTTWRLLDPIAYEQCLSMANDFSNQPTTEMAVQLLATFKSFAFHLDYQDAQEKLSRILQSRL